MSASEHSPTPTPWRIFRTKRGTYIGVGEATGEGILDAGFGLWRSGPEREANAEFAVRAVNAHDDLVEALQMARECIVYCRRNHPDMQTGEGIPIEIFIDRALAKAQSNGG